MNRDHHSANYSFGWIIGSIGATLILVAIILLICILFKSIFCCSQTSKNRSVDSFTHNSHNFRAFQRGGLCSSSGLSCLCFKFGNKKPVTGDTSDRQLDVPTGIFVYCPSKFIVFLFFCEIIFVAACKQQNISLVFNPMMYPLIPYAVLIVHVGPH